MQRVAKEWPGLSRMNALIAANKPIFNGGTAPDPEKTVADFKRLYGNVHPQYVVLLHTACAAFRSLAIPPRPPLPQHRRH